ncbi:MAG: 1-deoxy-D-xylulose-5-phosphate synthase [Calditrichia bacterium]
MKNTLYLSPNKIGMADMSILEKINYPEDLRRLSPEELVQLSHEVREYLVTVIPEIGGHFASSLGVVELTVALHYLFQTPQDLLVWDVGHQAYAHKILTGRREAIKHIRQMGGISGFLKRQESPYDVFGAGHASTSISAALGLAKARDLKGENHKVVAIIGDGSLTGGMAYEALNNAGQSGTDLLVILNDNNMSISPNVGAIASYLNEIITNPLYQKIKNEVWDLTAKIPPFTNKIRTLARKTQESIKSFILPGMFFEDLGFRYFGPVNGHNMFELLQIIGRIKDLPGPKLLHVLTKKGKGYQEAEEHPDKYHGIKPLNGGGKAAASPRISYTEVFGKTMTQLADRSEKICAITAAMCDGTGLNEFREKYPARFFDVGIAEEHAVTFAGGLAAEGIRPVVAIYSTFLQRGFDQIIHDIALQKLPVVFALDRAGLVGEDGPTHHGSFDISYLTLVPDLIVAAPQNGQELRNMLYSALQQDRLPYAIRYPRSTVPDEVDFEAPFEEIPTGKWEELQPGSDLALLAVGSMVSIAREMLPELQRKGLNPGLFNCRFLKPLDEPMLHEILENYPIVVTLEENALPGGFGEKVSAFAIRHGYAGKVKLLQKGLPDEFVEHGSRGQLLDLTGLSAKELSVWLTQQLDELSEVSAKNGSAGL